MFKLTSMRMQFCRWLFLALGLLLGLPLFTVQAQSLPVITPENAGTLMERARLGQGVGYDATVSSDGRWVAVASSLGVWLYDATDWTQAPRLLPTDIFVAKVVFSPDNRWLVALADLSYDSKAAWVWSLATTTSVTLTLPQEPRLALFSPTGTWLTLLVGTSVYVFTPGQTTPTFILNDNDDTFVESVLFSPDEHILIALRYDSAHLWDLRTGMSVPFSSSTRLYAFHPDGSQLATYDRDRRLRVWDITDLENIGLVAAPRVRLGEGYSVQYTPDGTSLVTTGSNGVQIWETLDYTLIDNLSETPQKVDSNFKPVFSPDSRWIALLTPDEIEIWDTTQQMIVQRFQGRYSPWEVHFTPDSQSLAAFFRTYDDRRARYVSEARLYALADGKQLRHYHQNIPLFPWQFNTTNSGQVWLIGHSAADHLLLELTTGETFLEFAGHHSSVNSVAFSPDGQTLVSTAYEELRLWAIATESQIGFYEPARVGNNEIAFYGETQLNVASYDNFYVFDIAAQTTINTAIPSNAIAYTMSQDGTLIAVNEEYDRFDVWDIATETRVLSHKTDFYPTQFSPDNRYLALYRSNQIYIFDRSQKDFVATLDRRYGAGVALTFTPDSRQFVFYSQLANGIAIWDIDQAAIVRELGLPEPDNIRQLVVSPDGTLLAVAYTGGELLLWDIAKNVERFRAKAHNGAIHEIRFNPIGTIIATGGADGTVRLWGIPDP